MKLELELIPECNWYKSLANLLPKPVWDSVRREVYQKFNYTCAICGAVNTRVNCHEVWRYDDRKCVQSLKGLQCLCNDCHNIKHYGRTVGVVHEGKLPSSYLDVLTKHFRTVNDCSVGDFVMHKVKMGELSHKRSRKTYRIDWGILSPENIIREWGKEKRSQS